MTQVRDRLWAREHLHAWCIVQYDANPRGPDQRAAMLERLGFRNFAYDWLDQHIPTFEAEITALKRHHINLVAWWFLYSDPDDPVVAETLEIFRRNDVQPQLWVMQSIKTPFDWTSAWPKEITPQLLSRMDAADAQAILTRAREAFHELDTPKDATEQEERLRLEAERIKTFADFAARYGCQVELYNHGGWFGNIDNQLAILARLRARNTHNVGLVYNFVDARDEYHDDIRNFEQVWARIQAHVHAVNLAGIGQTNHQIVNLSQGECELEMMRIIAASGWHGPIGLFAHAETQDAEATLRDRLKGFDWLVAELQSPGSGGPRVVRPVVERR